MALLNKSKLQIISLLSLSSIASISCNAASAPQGYFEPQTLEEVSAGTNNDPQAGAGNAKLSRSIDGYWAHYSEVSTCVAIGSSLEQINRSFYLVKVEQSLHGALQETWEACQIDLT